MAKNKKRKAPRKFKESGHSIISDEIDIPNHSGMLDAGKVHRTPTDNLDPVNKLYIDSKDVESFPTSLTDGSIPFSDGSNLVEDNASLHWDKINKRLGIGTNNPLELIHIKKGVSGQATPDTDTDLIIEGVINTGINILTPSANNGRITFGDESSSSSGRILYFHPSDSFAWRTAGVERMRLNATGLGIGGTPTLPLTVFGSWNAGTTTTGVQCQATSGDIIGIDINNIAFNNLTLRANARPSGISITPTGRVGINIIAPSKELDVVGSATISGGLDGNTSFSATGDLKWLADDGSTVFIFDVDGNGGSGAVGIGTATPGAALDLATGDIDDVGDIGVDTINEQCKITALGGYAILLTNETGVNSVAGKTVKADTATDDAVILTAAADNECMGVFLDSGIADGAEAWVVVSGVADVAMGDNEAAAHGNWVETNSGEAGYADATSASPAAAPQHFNEIGHCIETVAAGGEGTHILARCVLHFN